MISNQNKVIYLIRHARSVYNQAEHQNQQKYACKIQKLKQEPDPQQGLPMFEATPQYLHMKFESDLWDCDILSPQGEEECRDCRQKMKDIPVDLIIVSPLRRALTTCDLVFKDHRSQPPVIVDPDFREIQESICDIGSRLRESMKDYPHFDYSLIENVDYWYIDSLNNEQEKKRMVDQIRKLPLKQQSGASKILMLQYIKQLWKRRGQNPLLKSEALSPISLQKSKLKLLLQNYSSIAIVTHSQNIKSYTRIKPPNCSIMKYLPHFLDLPISDVPHLFV